MKNKYIVLAIILSVYACTTENVRFNDLVSITKNKDTITANGFDTVIFDLTFNKDTNIDLIKAKAEIFNGRFIDSENNELTIEPIKDVNGVIKARIGIISTTIPNSILVTFTINGYKTIETIETIKSLPSTTSLDVSAFSVANSYQNEVTISGSVLSDIGKKASDGYQVLIQDTFEDGLPINGAYRESALITKNAAFSVIYSPGPIPSDQFINIKATVLDENGAVTEVINQIQLYITNTD